MTPRARWLCMRVYYIRASARVRVCLFVRVCAPFVCVRVCVGSSARVRARSADGRLGRARADGLRAVPRGDSARLGGALPRDGRGRRAAPARPGTDPVSRTGVILLFHSISENSFCFILPQRIRDGFFYRRYSASR